MAQLSGDAFAFGAPLMSVAEARALIAERLAPVVGTEAVRLARALSDAAAAHDLLITSGGVSTGEEDHVKAAVEAAGSLSFWRVAIKPGRPVAMGVVRGAAFIGLPGNPVAAFATFLQLARPLIARLAGEDFQPPP